MTTSTTVNLTKIEEAYSQLIEIIKTTFGEESDRAKKLIQLYTDYEERVKEAPASGKLNFHNAFEGGYILHILNVLECAKLMKRLYVNRGGLIDFTDEELVMVALHHDLGKLGTLEEPKYVIQDSEWHQKNKLEIYKQNDDRQYMTVTDGARFLLQEYGIKLTKNEYLAIGLTDGLYDSANETYLKQYGAGPFPLRCNLFHIMHWADHMAANIENDSVRQRLTRTN